MNEGRRQILDRIVWGISIALLVVLLAQPSFAASPAAPDAAATWREECGSCHIAYPPRFLSATAWRAVVARLDQHFGVDASVDPTRVAAIRSFLEAQAALSATPVSGAATPRISTLPWFVREHSEVSADVWRRPSVRSRANCAACHSAAEQGVFNDDGIRIPR
jgi:hypothetical protein